MKEGAREVWTDHLFEKHECGSASTKSRAIEVDGAKVQILSPRWLPEIEVVTTALKGDLLFILGRIRAPKEWGVDGNGAVLVARRREDGSYGVHVWHELYQWALGHLVPEGTTPGSTES